MIIRELDANKRIDNYHSGPKLKNINQNIVLEKTQKWIRGIVFHEMILSSKNSFILLEDGHLPTYYFPKDDIKMNLLFKNKKTTFCPLKGEATYWDFRCKDGNISDIAWSYECPIEGQKEITGLIAFYWNKLDKWYEEAEEIFCHPRDPYVRVDAIKSSRNVKIFLEKDLILSTNKPIILFETHKEPKYFFSINEIEANLVFSETIFRCPYKGVSNYLSIKENNKTFKDVIMQYTEPRPEVTILKNLACFEKNDSLSVIVD
ncbi:MAG: hypothetical protein CFH01_00575 [Alphaproteobacteria bacterium MarineAlpha2_Bin1]|nr:MAG: hypothetical protein CFH01_00575 [Alphaproteobacteria bacterium MarineAlpha2_Bin1]|tara:strand:+ start:52 stop:834 length:783 start_codon:yes stop_codon:yes gene_type:complete